MQHVICAKPYALIPQLLCEAHHEVEKIGAHYKAHCYPGNHQRAVHDFLIFQVAPGVDDKEHDETGPGEKEHEFE